VSDLTPDHCPLCGGPNACAIAGDGGSCWCFSTPIGEGVLERIPEAERGRACVCQACATSHRGVEDRDEGDADQGGRDNRANPQVG
jgi:hypothetical protein